MRAVKAVADEACSHRLRFWRRTRARRGTLLLRAATTLCKRAAFHRTQRARHARRHRTAAAGRLLNAVLLLHHCRCGTTVVVVVVGGADDGRLLRFTLLWDKRKENYKTKKTWKIQSTYFDFKISLKNGINIEMTFFKFCLQ